MSAGVELSARIATLEARIAELTRELDEAKRVARAALEMVQPAFKHLRTCTAESAAAAARAERDESVGLLREVAGPVYDGAPHVYVRCGGCGYDVKACDAAAWRCLGRKARAFLARLAAAPEKETTPKGAG